MKYILFFISFLVFINDSYTQNQVLDSIKEHHLIYINTSDRYSTTITEHNFSNTTRATSRIVDFSYKIGTNGIRRNIGKKGKDLKNIIADDSLALAEFENYIKHRKKAKRYNTIQLLGYPLALGGAALAVIGVIKKENSTEDVKVTPEQVMGGVIIIGGIVVINVWSHKCHDELDEMILSMNKCIEVYNDNLLKKHQ